MCQDHIMQDSKLTIHGLSKLKGNIRGDKESFLVIPRSKLTI